MVIQTLSTTEKATDVKNIDIYLTFIHLSTTVFQAQV